MHAHTLYMNQSNQVRPAISQEPRLQTKPNALFCVQTKPNDIGHEFKKDETPFLAMLLLPPYKQYHIIKPNLKMPPRTSLLILILIIQFPEPRFVSLKLLQLIRETTEYVFHGSPELSEIVEGAVADGEMAGCEG